MTNINLFPTEFHVCHNLTFLDSKIFTFHINDVMLSKCTFPGSEVLFTGQRVDSCKCDIFWFLFKEEFLSYQWTVLCKCDPLLVLFVLVLSLCFCRVLFVNLQFFFVVSVLITFIYREMCGDCTKHIDFRTVTLMLHIGMWVFRSAYSDIVAVYCTADVECHFVTELHL